MFVLFSHQDICVGLPEDSVTGQVATLWIVHTGVEVEVDKKSTTTFCPLRLRRQCGRGFIMLSGQYRIHCNKVSHSETLNISEFLGVNRTLYIFRRPLLVKECFTPVNIWFGEDVNKSILSPFLTYGRPIPLLITHNNKCNNNNNNVYYLYRLCIKLWDLGGATATAATRMNDLAVYKSVRKHGYVTSISSFVNEIQNRVN